MNMEVSTAGSGSNSYASVLLPAENSPKQKGITNDNNKENIPGKILTDKDDQRTADKPKENDNATVESKHSEEVDESGFVPVISHGKKDKKLRQMERRGGDQRDVGSKPPKSTTSKSQERPEKPKRSRRDRKAAKDKTATPPQANHHDSSDPDKAADSSDGQNDKKIKFVEAPLPQVNPWVSSSSGPPAHIPLTDSLFFLSPPVVSIFIEKRLNLKHLHHHHQKQTKNQMYSLNQRKFKHKVNIVRMQILRLQRVATQNSVGAHRTSKMYTFRVLFIQYIISYNLISSLKTKKKKKKRRCKKKL